VKDFAPDENPLQDDLDHILVHTRDVWDEVRGKAIFVTGGTGFFGRWLLESFAHANNALQLGARLVVLSRNPDAFRARAPHLSASIEFVRGDVRSFDLEKVQVQLSSPPPRFDCVIHAATESATNLNAEDPLMMVDTVVQGTRAALEFARAAGARRFLFTSSGAVYGRQPSEMMHVPEEYTGGPDCTNPSSAYGEGKRLAELLCASYAQRHGIEAVIARCFAFVGPFLPLDAHFAVGNFIRDVLRQQPIRIGGDGTPFRSYLHAADLATWLWTLLVRGDGGRAYNVGSEDGRSIKQIAEVVAEAGDAKGVEIAQKPDPARPLARYVPQCRRAREELGLQEWISLPDAVTRTISVVREQQRRAHSATQ
jgi:dTDP-glucose 4,6-dehydratase